jgi:hypothetical protein
MRIEIILHFRRTSLPALQLIYSNLVDVNTLVIKVNLAFKGNFFIFVAQIFVLESFPYSELLIHEIQ